MKKRLSDINLLSSDSVCYSLRKAYMSSFGLPFCLEWYFPSLMLAIAKGRTFKSARQTSLRGHRQSICSSLVDTQQKTARQTPLTHSQGHKRNNPQLDRVSSWLSKTLLFGGKKAGKFFGADGPCVVWVGQGNICSAGAHDLSAVHAHSQLALYYLQPYFRLVFAHDGGNLS